MTAIPPGWTPEQARKRLEAATPGPWAVWIDEQLVKVDGADENGEASGPHICSTGRVTWPQANEDAAFIAHAPQDIAALLALLDEARRERDWWKDEARSWGSFSTYPGARFAAPEDGA